MHADIVNEIAETWIIVGLAGQALVLWMAWR